MYKPQLIILLLLISVFSFITNQAYSQEIIHGWQIFNTSNSSIPDDHICDVKVAKNDAVWVATWSGGLGKFEDLMWTVYNPANSTISSNSINQIAFDKKNRVWAATNGGGVSFFNGETWTAIELPGENTALCIAIGKRGDKLIGTPKHGLYLYDRTGNLTKIWGVAEQHQNKVYHICFDKDGSALVSTPQGLLRFKKTVQGGYSTSFSFVRREHTLQSMVDSDGRILAVDYETGHLYIENGNKWSHEKKPNEDIMISMNGDGHDYSVSAMTLYKKGRIVVGTRYFGGIVLQQKKEKYWSPILPPYAGYDLQGGITCLAEAEDESIWVGTYQRGLMIPIDDRPEPDTTGTIQGPASSEAELEKARKMMQRRRVVVKDTVTIEGGEVDLMVWDAQKPDGDVITLIFNGQILLDKYEVTKKPARLRLTIEPNKPNKLVMYAHNTGDVPPNTAMLSIIHTDEEKEIELTSDLVNAGALIIIQDVMKSVKKKGKDTKPEIEEEEN